MQVLVLILSLIKSGSIVSLVLTEMAPHTQKTENTLPAPLYPLLLSECKLHSGTLLAEGGGRPQTYGGRETVRSAVYQATCNSNVVLHLAQRSLPSNIGFSAFFHFCKDNSPDSPNHVIILCTAVAKSQLFCILYFVFCN